MIRVCKIDCTESLSLLGMQWALLTAYPAFDPTFPCILREAEISSDSRVDQHELGKLAYATSLASVPG